MVTSRTIEEVLAPLLASDLPLFWQGPASPRSIDELEARLAAELPDSVRLFLAHCGGGGIEGELLSGIEGDDASLEYAGTILGDTLRCRLEFSLPADQIVVYFSDDEVCWCVAGRSVGTPEPPVMSYDLFSKRLDATVAQSFLALLRDYVSERTLRQR